MPPFVSESLGVSCPCVLTQEANIYKTENNIYNSELVDKWKIFLSTNKKEEEAQFSKALY